MSSDSLCLLEPTVAKNQYGVSVRHDPTVHQAISTAASWYDVKLQKAFDILIWDRAEALLEHMRKDLLDLREASSADERPRRKTFQEVIKDLFGIDVPGHLGGDRPLPKHAQRKTRHRRKEA